METDPPQAGEASSDLLQDDEPINFDRHPTPEELGELLGDLIGFVVLAVLLVSAVVALVPAGWKPW